VKLNGTDIIRKLWLIKSNLIVTSLSWPSPKSRLHCNCVGDNDKTDVRYFELLLQINTAIMLRTEHALTGMPEHYARVGKIHGNIILEPENGRLRTAGSTAQHHRVAAPLDGFQRRIFHYLRVATRNCTQHHTTSNVRYIKRCLIAGCCHILAQPLSVCSESLMRISVIVFM